MEPIRIFVISRDTEVLAEVLAFFAQKGFEADGASENPQAMEEFAKKQYDLAVIGGGVDNASATYLKKNSPLLVRK